MWELGNLLAEEGDHLDLRGLVVPDEVRAVARAVARTVARRELLGACLAMRGECSGVDMRMRMHACTPRTTQVPTAPCELLVSDATAVPEWLQLQPFPTLTFALKVTGKPPPEPEPEA